MILYLLDHKSLRPSWCFWLMQYARIPWFSTINVSPAERKDETQWGQREILNSLAILAGCYCARRREHIDPVENGNSDYIYARLPNHRIMTYSTLPATSESMGLISRVSDTSFETWETTPGHDDPSGIESLVGSSNRRPS